jgi:hypothetical protein
LIQLNSVQPRFFGKNSLPLDVDGLIAQLAGGRTQPMAREVMRMPRLDDYPFHSLRHFKDRYFEAAQTASATVTSIGIWWWRIMEK